MKEGEGRVFRGPGALSLQFLDILYKSYKEASVEVKSEDVNPYCSSAILVYPLAIATWESFFVECIFNEVNFMSHPSSKINSIPIKIMERWDIHDKNIIVLELLYNKTFDKSKQPYQDFRKLVAIRNELIHFKVNEPKDRFLKMIYELSNIGIFGKVDTYETLRRTSNWESYILTLGGIKWAINTIVNMVKTLYELVPENDITRLYMKSIIDKFVVID